MSDCRWSPPCKDRLKLNVDVACRPNRDGVGLGAVVRDDGVKLVVAHPVFTPGRLEAESDATGMVQMLKSLTFGLSPYGLKCSICWAPQRLWALILLIESVIKWPMNWLILLFKSCATSDCGSVFPIWLALVVGKDRAPLVTTSSFFNSSTLDHICHMTYNLIK